MNFFGGLTGYPGAARAHATYQQVLFPWGHPGRDVEDFSWGKLTTPYGLGQHHYLFIT